MSEQSSTSGVAGNPESPHGAAMEARTSVMPYSPEDFGHEIARVKRKRRTTGILGVIVALLIVGLVVAMVTLQLPSSM